MNLTPVQKQLFTTVSANDSEVLEYVVPNGKTLVIQSLGGSAAYAATTHAKICWDPTGAQAQCLFVTHGTTVITTMAYALEGDGTRKIQILLDNTSSNVETMGGWWSGYLRNS